MDRNVILKRRNIHTEKHEYERLVVDPRCLDYSADTFYLDMLKALRDK